MSTMEGESLAAFEVAASEKTSSCFKLGGEEERWLGSVGGRLTASCVICNVVGGRNVDEVETDATRFHVSEKEFEERAGRFVFSLCGLNPVFGVHGIGSEADESVWFRDGTNGSDDGVKFAEGDGILGRVVVDFDGLRFGGVDGAGLPV